MVALFNIVPGNRAHVCILYVLVLRKWLGLSVAAVYPPLKVRQVDRGNDNLMLVCPILTVIGKISIPCIVFFVESQHNLVFVKRAVFVVLVHHIHPASVPSVYVVGQEHVDMVAVHALRTTYVAVGVLHSGLPRIAVCIRATTHAAFRVLDRDVELPDAHMAFLVVPGFFLRFCRILFSFCLRLCNFFT